MTSSSPAKPPTTAWNDLSHTPTTNWFRSWWPALLWAAFIFVMSTDTFSSEHTKWFFEPIIRWLAPSLTALQLDRIHHYIRKSAHFTEYFVFGALLYRAISGARMGWRWSWGLLALVIAAAYSASDEFHQLFVPGRMASPYDSLLDTVGASCAILALYLWFARRRPQPKTTGPAGASASAATPE
jgi:VanZ family protein